MTKRLTREQIERYHRDGFLAPIDVMTPEAALALRRKVEEMEKRYPDVLNAFTRNNAHYIFPFLDAVVHDDSILDVVEDILGPDLLAWGTVFFTKEPGDPGFVSWHQDTRYAGLEPHEALTAWIALSPATPENGCMRMIPGSHKGPVLPHSDTFGAHNLLTRGQTIQEVDETGAIDVVLQPGQMSLHHLNVIHGSRPNRSRERRMGFAIQHYMPAHIRQTLGEDYALLVRGTDRHGHFKPGRRPTGDVEPEAIAFREHVNKALKDIVYQGATERRSY